MYNIFVTVTTVVPLTPERAHKRRVLSKHLDSVDWPARAQAPPAQTLPIFPYRLNILLLFSYAMSCITPDIVRSHN